MTTLHVKSPNGTQKDIDVDKIFTTDGGTINGAIGFEGGNNTFVTMGFPKGANNCHIGWQYGANDGALIVLRSRYYVESQAGAFEIHAKKPDAHSMLFGNTDGTLTWNNHNIITDTTPYNLTLNKDSAHIDFKCTSVERGVAPSVDIGTTLSTKDKNNKNMNQFQAVYSSSKNNITRMIAYNCLNTDDQYAYIGVGWDSNGKWYTYAPTPANNNNSNNIATTAFVHNNYLPLSGGILTGGLTLGTEYIKRSVDNAVTTVCGGTSYLNGAYLVLHGKTESVSPGLFALQANDGSHSITLHGKPDGTLTWGNHDVIYETARYFTERSGYCKLNNGLLLQYGTAPASTSPYTLTFPIAWSSTNSYAMSICHAGGTPTRVSYSRITNSQATFYLENTGDTFWIAIGY